MCINCSFIHVRDLQYGVAKNKITQDGSTSVECAWARYIMYVLGCMNPECQDTHITEFFILVPNIFSVITAVLFLTYRNVCQLACSKQKVPANNDIHRSLQDCWSWVWNLLHDILWVPRIWKGPSRLFGKFVDPCECSCMKLVSVAGVATSCN